MTPTPRETSTPRNRVDAIRSSVTGTFSRITGNLGGKTLVYLGAGLALAGIGAATATTSFSGSAASAAQPSPQRVVAASTVHQRPADRAVHAGHAVRHAAQPQGKTWTAVATIVAKSTDPKAGTGRGPLPAQDRLTPAGTSGPQTWMPISAARYDNARTIVAQALAKHMGLRSAVIAVATSMQESGLLNISYGTSDSLGLFQQRPSMGWGSAQQVLHPRFAADAFLGALRTYQASDPGWAHQPLWQSAQGVQNSGFPYAYAKWEAQAAHLVKTVTRHLV